MMTFEVPFILDSKPTIAVQAGEDEIAQPS